MNGGAREEEICSSASQETVHFGHVNRCSRPPGLRQYLKRHGEGAALLADPTWPATKADAVAAALLDWGRESGATTITHWFQPLGSTLVRHGMSAQVGAAAAGALRGPADDQPSLFSLSLSAYLPLAADDQPSLLWFSTVTHHGCFGFR